MGFVMSKIWALFASQGEVKVILIGLDNAGAFLSVCVLLSLTLGWRREDDDIVQTVSAVLAGRVDDVRLAHVSPFFGVGSFFFARRAGC